MVSGLGLRTRKTFWPRVGECDITSKVTTLGLVTEERDSMCLQEVAQSIVLCRVPDFVAASIWKQAWPSCQ
jgi:hypothetical protein